MSFNGLGEAVVERAVKDYRWALSVIGYSNLHPEQICNVLHLAKRYKKDCESFFMSRQLVEFYCNVDGMLIMKTIRSQVEKALKENKPLIIVDNCFPGIKFGLDK